MNSNILCRVVVSIAALTLTTTLHAQKLVTNGEWAGFVQEQPPLSYEQISEPFVVRKIRGTIVYAGGKPLEAAYFEIGIGHGSTLGTYTDKNGRFDLASFRLFGPFVRSAAIRPGTYRFKVTKDGFHSTVGIIKVSDKAPKESAINIALESGEGYKEERPNPVPDEVLLPPSNVATIEPINRKKYPQKYSSVYMPVSLAVGRVRTPEFPVEKRSQWVYDIMLEVEKPLPFQRMTCLMGATAGPLDEKDCEKDDPIVRADWTVWEDGRIVQWGSMPNHLHRACIFTDKKIFELVGEFPLEAGKKYVVQVHFTNDGSPLNVANPHLIVIPHKDMW